MGFTHAETQLPAPVVASQKMNWFLTLFSVPFILIGLHMIWRGFWGLLGDDSGSSEVMQLAAGFIFTAMGSAACWASVRGGRDDQRRALLRARHPTEPWRWRADWDTGRIPCETRATALGILFFAVIWNAFCIPMLWAVPSGDAPFVWLFVIAGAGLAIAAGVLTWRWLRFGRSVFEQTTLPGRLGDRLRGTIQLRGRLLPQKGFRATLSCISYTSGKNGSERILWQEEGTVANEAATVGPLGTAVPVDFPLPADGLPSRLPGEPSGILWRLELSADVPGVDFATAFEVPVFARGDATAITRQATEGESETELGPVLRPEAPMTLDRERYTPD